jgi:peptidoglycan glycosyltransferase
MTSQALNGQEGQAVAPPARWSVSRRERGLLLLAAAFVVVGMLDLLLCAQRPEVCNASLSFRPALMAVLGWGLCFATAHVTLSRHLPRRDPLLLPVAALLSGWGLTMVGRLAPNFLPRQTTWLLLSTLAMLSVALVGRSLRWLRRFRYTWLLAGLALLAATLFLGVNPSGRGPRLWLDLGGAYLQPSEPLKLLMVAFLASYLAERRDLLLTASRRIGPLRLPGLAYGGPLLVMFGLTVLLLVWQQDLGAAMLFFFTFLTMLYLATGRWEQIAVGLILFLVAGALGYTASDRLASRFDGWLDPWPQAADQAFQIVQSLIAVGSGGLLGQGLGMGRPGYIPAVHTDFVFAAVAEELGLAGSLALVALFGILLLRGARTALRAPRAFERLLAAGLTAGLMIQAWIIMGANVKLVPIAGVTLPFLSYGGSSLLFTFIGVGLLLRISDLRRKARQAPSGAVTRRFSLLRVAGVLSLCLGLLGVGCGYWAVARADWLKAREDNPRRVAYEQRVQRGRILDRDGRVLAGVVRQVNGVVERTYPAPEAAPVVGYASLRHGTGGVEAAFDQLLRGEAYRSTWQAAWAELLHRPPQGKDVQLTLDADLQRLAHEALVGRAGGVVLLDSRTGGVLAMASAPTFDPAALDQEWAELREDPSAPLLNRATQGLYQPGAALETIVLAEALEQGLVYLTDPLSSTLTGTVMVDGTAVGCLAEPSEMDGLVAAYQAACPAPFAALGVELGEAGLAAAVERWGLTTPPPLRIPTESGTWSPGDGVEAEAIGQGSLTVSPLHMALVAATLADGGRMPDPQVTWRVESPGGGWLTLEEPEVLRSPISGHVARTLLLAWQPYGPQALGHVATAVAGEDRLSHAWFLGVAPASSPRYAVAVLLERSEEPLRAAQIGRALLEAALAP